MIKITGIKEKAKALADRGKGFLDILGDSLIDESRKGKAEVLKVADAVSDKLGLDKGSEPVR